MVAPVIVLVLFHSFIVIASEASDPEPAREGWIASSLRSSQ
jgi:hypothetical protein